MLYLFYFFRLLASSLFWFLIWEWVMILAVYFVLLSVYLFIFWFQIFISISFSSTFILLILSLLWTSSLLVMHFWSNKLHSFFFKFYFPFSALNTNKPIYSKPLSVLWPMPKLWWLYRLILLRQILRGHCIKVCIQQEKSL